MLANGLNAALFHEIQTGDQSGNAEDVGRSAFEDVRELRDADQR